MQHEVWRNRDNDIIQNKNKKQVGTARSKVRYEFGKVQFRKMVRGHLGRGGGGGEESLVKYLRALVWGLDLSLLSLLS